MSAVRDRLFNIFATTLHIWRPFLHPQPEDAPCRGDRDRHIKDPLWLRSKSKIPAPGTMLLVPLFICLRNTETPAKCPWRRGPRFRNPYPSTICFAVVCVCYVTGFFRNSSPQLVSSGIGYPPRGPGWPPRTTPIRDEMASLTRLIGHQTQPQFPMTSVYKIEHRGLFCFQH